MSSRDQKIEEFIEAARAQVGYRALPMKQSVWGQAVGYPGQTWNGAFVEAIAEKVGMDFPCLTSTNHALSALIKADRIYRNPKRGDVVFLETAVVGEEFGQPAVAVVSDVSEWERMRAFKAVAGQVGSPAPRGSNDPTGVFERVWYETDVLGFARPGKRRKFRVPSARREGSAALRLSNFQYGKSNRGVEILQRSLGLTVGLRDAVRGKFDAQTKSAYAAWQRRCGLVGSDADGTVDLMSLERLGNETGLFTVKD